MKKLLEAFYTILEGYKNEIGMAINFIITKEAQEDIFEIIDWYNFKQSGLGDRFYKELLIEFQKIAQVPSAYSYYIKDFRRAVLQHFPHLITLSLQYRKLLFYSVLYGGRNPVIINKKIT